MTADIERLVAWLGEHGVTHVAMGSTGVYGKPVIYLLEPHVEVILAHAAQVTAVPGRTTDVTDSAWLLDLLQHGLVGASFIPPAPIRALRAVTRHRANLVADRTRARTRIQTVLEDATSKRASVARAVLGVSGRALLAAIVAGEEDPAQLALLARGTLRTKQAALVQALSGRVPAHHRVHLRLLLAQVDHLDGAITQPGGEIRARRAPYAAALAVRCTIAGVKQRAAAVVVAAIGVAMGRFRSSRHRCSWAGRCPGNDESAGKRRSGRMRTGNRGLTPVLLQAAWAAIKVKGG
jgi:transposase